MQNPGSQHLYLLSIGQVAQQERELDQAYDAIEKELRATECKDSTPVGAFCKFMQFLLILSN